MIKVLIVGSGAREHALLKKIQGSSRVARVFVAPGNGGMLQDADCIPIQVDEIERLADFAQVNHVDLTIVGPELPLTLGIVDVFQARGLAIFGPEKKASVLEGSKVFTKEFCRRHTIPTAPFQVFAEATEAKRFIRSAQTFPIVIKADGLAAGKGVVIAQDVAEALRAIDTMMVEGAFGSAGHSVVIEEFISGEEASFIIVSDGNDFVEFLSSQDHKRLLDGDRGPNTGGMGAYAPAPLVTPALKTQIIDRIIRPTLAGMCLEGRLYKGFLYAGVMVHAGEPYLLEYNCRLGDPEAQVILPLLKSDLVELIQRVGEGKLNTYKPEFYPGSAVGVVLASEGYPAGYKKGFQIMGLDQVTDPDVTLYHSGTVYREGHYLTDGGRVLTVTARGGDLAAAIERVYRGVEKIAWPGLYYRRDIAQKGL